MKNLNILSFVLVVVGGLNWLLVGLGDWNLVTMIFGPLGDWAVRTVYILVGLSAVMQIANYKSNNGSKM